jgi:hypothetical protein
MSHRLPESRISGFDAYFFPLQAACTGVMGWEYENCMRHYVYPGALVDRK